MKERPILFSGPMVRAILDGRKTQTRRVMTPQPYWSDDGVPRFNDTEPGDIFVCPDFLPTSEERGRVLVECESRGTYHHMGQREFAAKHSPCGVPGDRLWVKETWRTRREWDRIAPSKLPVTEDSSFTALTLREQYITYAESDTQANKLRGKLRPSNHMPRWASRITLEIVGVRVERLQDISDENAEAEGIEAMSNMDIPAWRIYGKDLSVSCTHSPKKAFKELWNSINGPDSWQANPWVWVVQFRRVEQ